MKKQIAFLLAVLMLFCAAAPALAEQNTDLKHFDKMLVFGDSITCAYGLPTCASYELAKDSYSDFVAQAVGADCTSLAFTGCSIDMVMYMIGLDSEVEDIELAKEYLNTTKDAARWELLEEIRNGQNAKIGEVSERIRESDLVEIAIGSNDLGTIPFKRAKSAYEKALKAGADDMAALTTAAQTYVEMLQLSLHYFFKGYPRIIERVQELNPDATIVLVGGYNPFVNVWLPLGDDSEMTIGEAINAVTKAENEQLKLWAAKYGCIYADVFDVSYSFPANSLERALKNKPLDSHPDYAGHKYMAEQIISVLPRAEKKLWLPKNGSVRFDINGVNAGSFALERHGLFWSIRDEATGQYLSTDKTGAVIRTDAPAMWFYNGGFWRIGTVMTDSRFGFSFFRLTKQYLSLDEGGVLASAASKCKVSMFVPG